MNKNVCYYLLCRLSRINYLVAYTFDSNFKKWNYDSRKKF